MKLYDKKRIIYLILSIVGGLCFSAYLLYDQSGKIGRIEIISLTATAIMAIIILVALIKIGNK